VHDNFKPYGIKKHRHTIEIQETLSETTGQEVTIQFTPHLLPVDRGILTSVYAIPAGKVDQKTLDQVYAKYYDKEYFIRLVDIPPEIKHVRGTNYTDINPYFDERTNNILVFSAIDNLVKGAAGQAVQNMNIMLGFEENEALDLIPVMP
jgi:N-acetyl-gamma-glutamyl-phosphate reductase